MDQYQLNAPKAEFVFQKTSKFNGENYICDAREILAKNKNSDFQRQTILRITKEFKEMQKNHNINHFKGT